MTPEAVASLTQALTILIPSIGAFLVGHYKLLIPKAPSTPATPATPGTPAQPSTPATPVAPVANPNGLLPIGQGGLLQALGLAFQGINPATPTAPPVAIAPIGQGGLIQIVTLALQGIMASPTATPQEKASAASAVVTATAPFITPGK